MFGFEFAVYTFLSALVCSITAKRKNKDTNMWWLAGLILGILPLFYLLFSSSKKMA